VVTDGPLRRSRATEPPREATTAGERGPADASARSAADAADAAAPHGARAVRASLGAGAPLEGSVRARMETGLRTSFGGVRVHTDPHAAGLAMALGARAFAVGEHVAFAPGEYRPGTLIGDALLAHELAHTRQQAGAARVDETRGDDQALERDATHAATAALGFGGSGREGRWLRRQVGLRLQRCDRSDAELATIRDEIAPWLANPDAHADEILRALDDLNRAEALKVVNQLSALQDPSRLAMYEGGRRVLEAVVAILMRGNVVEQMRGEELQAVLDRYAAGARTPTQDEGEALSRINSAISSDTADQLQAYAERPPLHLPVQIYERGREVVGGVYYDPAMPAKPSSSGLAGQTETSHLSGTAGGSYEFFHAGYIRLGPLAATSPEVARSILRHEHMHYRLQLQRNERIVDPDLSALQEDIRVRAATAEPDEEVEILSAQFAYNYAELSDDELRANLRYLGSSLAGASTRFKERGIRRIVDFVRDDPVKQARLLRLIDAEGRADKARLSDLRAAVAALAPAPAETPAERRRRRRR
jgi:hypothetical protein